MSKIETTSKVSVKLPSRINFGRQGERVELSFLDTPHKHPHNLEKVNLATKILVALNFVKILKGLLF